MEQLIVDADVPFAREEKKKEVNRVPPRSLPMNLGEMASISMGVKQVLGILEVNVYSQDTYQDNYNA